MQYRIWVISELYSPEETSTGYFLTKIAEGLTEKFRVCVLCSQPTYSYRGRRAPTDEFHNGVSIHRCWSTTFNKDVLLLRLVNVVTITLSIFFNALQRFRAGDCSIVVTNPPALPFAVALACFLRRARCILVIHDVYPELLVATGMAKQRSLPIRVAGWLTQGLYRRVKRIVVLGRDMATLAQAKLPEGDIRVVVIPNWADLDLVQPRSRSDNSLLKKLALNDKFVVQYGGNIGRSHGLEILVDCAEQLSGDAHVHFLFVGSGAKKTWLKETVRDRAMTNITVLDHQPRSNLSTSLNACDVAVISFIHGMSGISVPSRMYNIMAAGKPIIAVADTESELARVVGEESIGWVIQPGDVDGLRMAIIKAKASPDRLAQMGQRARWAAETKYSLECVNKAYADLVSSLYD